MGDNTPQRFEDCTIPGSRAPLPPECAPQNSPAPERRQRIEDLITAVLDAMGQELDDLAAHEDGFRRAMLARREKGNASRFEARRAAYAHAASEVRKWRKGSFSLDELVEAALEDTALLDFLDTRRDEILDRCIGTGEPELVGYQWCVEGQCEDVRTAIREKIKADAERAAQPKPEKNDDLPF